MYSDDSLNSVTPKMLRTNFNKMSKFRSRNPSQDKNSPRLNHRQPCRSKMTENEAQEDNTFKIDNYQMNLIFNYYRYYKFRNFTKKIALSRI